jgi:hypothetical protein
MQLRHSLKKGLARIMARAVAALLHPRIVSSPDFFYVLEGRRYHVTLVHFYSPIPDSRALAAELWNSPNSLLGLEMNAKAQLDLLTRIQQYRGEYNCFPLEEPASLPGKHRPFWINNGMFVAVDAEVLYSMVRIFRPRRLFEIGCGHSTVVSSMAIAANHRDDSTYDCEFVCCDPTPPGWLMKQRTNVTRFLQQPIQRTPLSDFDCLRANDVLFIDSSHVAATGSDVNFLLLQVLPRLASGVLIQIHDIHMPYEYPESWSKQLAIFWNEQYLVQAFLLFNKEFEILWAGQYLHRTHPTQLSLAFKSYNPSSTMPGSLWLRRR